MKRIIIIFILLLAVTLVSFALYTGMKGKETIQAGNGDADRVPEKIETVIAQASTGRREGEAGLVVPDSPVENQEPDLVNTPPREFDKTPEIYTSEKVNEKQIVPAERDDPEPEGEPAFIVDIDLPEKDVPVETAVPSSVTALTAAALQDKTPLPGSNMLQPAGKGAAALDDEPDVTVNGQSEALIKDNVQKVPVEKAEEILETETVRDERGSAGPGADGKFQGVPVPEAMPAASVIQPVIIPENEIVRPETDLVQRAEKEEVIIEEEPAEEVEEEEIIFKEEPAEIEIEEPVEVIEKLEPEKPLDVAVEIPLKDYEKRVAVLPFENFTENRDAPKHVFSLITGMLSGKGLAVIDEASLNDFLCKDRVRSTGYVSKELAGKIRERFKVGIILAGSILSYSSGENPRFGILARLIDSSDGEILWADYASATGEDFVTLFDLGRVNTLAHLTPRVTDMLFASFTIDGVNRKSERTRRVAVMPFRNNSDFKNAGMIAMHMFIIELLKNPAYRPVEYGNIRSSIVSLKIRNKGELSFNHINSLAKTVGAKGIIVGIVNNYSLGTDVSSPPKVDITVRLIDSQSSKIVWYSSAQLSGEENIIALDWGRIRSVHTVAYKVVTQLVDNMAATGRN